MSELSILYMDDKTSLSDVSIIKKKLVASTLADVYNALEERGYNPINQLVGYLISGDPGYISNYKDSREKIQEFDRAEVMAIVLSDYITKK